MPFASVRESPSFGTNEMESAEHVGPTYNFFANKKSTANFHDTQASIAEPSLLYFSEWSSNLPQLTRSWLKTVNRLIADVLSRSF